MKNAICTLEKDTYAARASHVTDLDGWWVQFGDQVLLYSANSKWNGITKHAKQAGLNLRENPKDVNKDDMYLVVQKGRLFQREYPDVSVLIDKGRYLAVELSVDQLKEIGTRNEPCFVIQPLQENSVVFEYRSPPATRTAPVTWIQNLVDNVGRSRYEMTLNHLVSYQTRFSTSTLFADAANWCRNQLDAMGYQTRLEEITAGSGSSFNVLADREGTGGSQRTLVLVVAHLDSINISGGPNADAPGADDNGSGSAGLLEIAYVLKDFHSVNDLRFVLFGGEEQGLHGSQQYVASLSTSERNRIAAIVNMDMIATLNTPTASVLLEGASVSQHVIDGLADAAMTYATLAVQTSLNPFASDHVPFIQANLPAVLTIEGTDSANSNIHTANDVLAHIDYDFALEILKMNVAYIAGKLEQKGEVILPNGIEIIPELLRPRLSGRYSYNGGATGRVGMSAEEAKAMPTQAALSDPRINLEKPVFGIDLPDWQEWFNRPRFTLHIDIDGPDPLHVVSGTVTQGLSPVGAPLPHFIGRVTSNILSGGKRNLIVEDFELQWPRSSHVIDRLEISLTGIWISPPPAEVTFIASGTGRQFGPYTIERESQFFRDVELEVDREDGAVNAQPYNTHTHPDRPADLPEENLTLVNTFAKSGIHIMLSPESNVINSADAGADNTWSDQELHDAMEDHWSAFANRPQWRMWIFLAVLADSPSLGGIMFDADINEPGGVDRQGTALFTQCPFFHTVGGGYIQANPPAAEAVERELFFNLIHETGHAFNLAHSFQKTLGIPWNAPAWMPLTSNAQALSWMNYPDAASPGLNATWFYDRFRFRFDDNENLFLRHAPARFVQMGNEVWFENHGRVSRGSLDRRYELKVRNLKESVELGEPVMLELRLENVSNEDIIVHENLSLTDGFIELAVTKPNGERRPFIPIMHTRTQIRTRVLRPQERLYCPINITVGHFGFPFKEHGAYRVEASYMNVDGGTAAAVMQLWVKPPANYEDRRVISELFNARIGRTLIAGGTRIMEDVTDKLRWVSRKLGEKHPLQFHVAKVLSNPFADRFKVLRADSNKISVLDQEPEVVQEQLEPVLKHTEEAADTIGHIEFKQVVDKYTRAAEETRNRAAARDAQKNMLGMFRQRNIIDPVIQSIEQRLSELK